MSTQSLRRRLNGRASFLRMYASNGWDHTPTLQEADDIDAILAAHKEAKRELAVARKHIKILKRRRLDFLDDTLKKGNVKL